MDSKGIVLKSPELQMLLLNSQDGYNYRLRKHADWDENYELYRDKVIINRLTQRQSVNLPLMKTQIRTLLKDVDDMPVLYFENLDNDKQAELFKNMYWEWTVEQNKMELQDIVDKRQVFLFGRSFDQWQIADGKVKMTVQDVMDIKVSRYTDPFNVHSARFLIHENIFEPLTVVVKNKDYDAAALAEMKEYYATQQGLITAKENTQSFTDKNKKMADMGVTDVQSPVLGETYVTLSMHFIFRNDEVDSKGALMPEQIFLYVVADNMRILMKKSLEEVIGTTTDHFWRNHYPYVTWADDLERQDFWSDGVADIIRTPNKVLNSWFSQLVENRTLRNMGMHYYNSSIEGFNPETYEPKPWGWYPIPIPANSNLNEMFQKVDVPDLTESLDEMNFLIMMSEKGTGATATQQGTPNQKQVTLGEVQLMVGEAKERIKGMSKFYTPAWKDRGLIFTKLIEAGHDKLDIVKLYTKGRNTNDLFPRDVGPNDYLSKSGYNVKVWSQDEKSAADIDSINKLDAVNKSFPGNPVLKEIYQRKLLTFGDLKPDEIIKVMEWQKKQEANPNPTPPPPKEGIAINYKDAPPDIQRQMEQAAGFKPSVLGVQPIPGAPGMPPGPGAPTGMPTLPSMSPTGPSNIVPPKA